VHIRYEGRGTLISEQPATLSFQPCSAGTMTNSAANSTRGDQVCIPCPKGFSTGDSGKSQCVPCEPGFFAGEEGTPHCQPCPLGEFVAVSNTSKCEPCPINAWAAYVGRTRCDVCDLDEYITVRRNSTLPGTGDGSSAAASSTPCVPCPFGAQCWPDGNVTAALGFFLLVNADSHLLSTVACSYLACVAPSMESADGASLPQAVPGTGLRIRNHCASGRYPAFSTLDHSAVADTDGLNLLCAHCLPSFCPYSMWTCWVTRTAQLAGST
jgi:hypothetical protein